MTTRAKSPTDNIIYNKGRKMRPFFLTLDNKKDSLVAQYSKYFDLLDDSSTAP